MADLVSYYTENVDEKPTHIGRSDIRNWVSDCTCLVCKEKEPATKVALFNLYDTITLESRRTLTPHEYLLCPAEIPAYVFRTRTWGKKQLTMRFKCYPD